MEYSICPNCFTNGFNGKVCVNCNYEYEEESSFALKMFSILDNRYIVGRVLGSGGFGITYVAFDILNQKRCAVKEYVPMGAAVRDNNSTRLKLSSTKHQEEFRHGLISFMKEAEIIKQLSSIPCVVNVMDYFEYNGTAYYVMEYLQGTTLKKLITASKTGLDINFANQIISRIGRTLDQIHKEKGFLHRDISPENIMVLDSGRVVLIDFGSAKNFFMNNNSGYTITLKHGFAPFEQYSSTGKQGPYTDLYALASTYYYMLTGKMIPRATDRVEGITYTPLVDMDRGISQEVSDAVDRALAIKYSERTQTVSEFLDEIIAKDKHEPTNTLNNTSQYTSFKDERKVCETSREIKAKEGNPYITVSIDGVDVNTVNIPKDRFVTVGRTHSKSEIVFENCGNISSLHCKIIYNSKKREFQIEDVSLNGTYINNIKMNKNVVYTLKEDDVIILANNRFRLVFGVK